MRENGFRTPALSSKGPISEFPINSANPIVTEAHLELVNNISQRDASDNPGIFVNTGNNERRNTVFSLITTPGHRQRWGCYYFVPYCNQLQSTAAAMAGETRFSLEMFSH